MAMYGNREEKIKRFEKKQEERIWTD
jgi:hypothetical protein